MLVRALPLALLIIPTLSWGVAGSRFQPAQPTSYSGSHQAEYNAQAERVRLLTRQAQVEVSSRLGLVQYQDGFQYPMAIRFQDGAPLGAESALAFVQLGRFGDSFAQELVVNLALMANETENFDQVFYHEMTHAVLNDAMGGEPSAKIPHWVQEGLAQYVSGEGDARVSKTAGQFSEEDADRLAVDLDAPPSGWAYPQYYLAIKYMIDTHSVNAVQNFVRDLIDGKPLEDAIRNSLSMDYATFRSEVHAYSLKVFRENARPSPSHPFHHS